MRVRTLFILAVGVMTIFPSYGYATIVDTITIHTSPLVSHPAGPFAIDFQFTDGNGTGDGNNTVVISNVNFGGGSSAGSAVLTGGATGDLSTSANLTDTS